MSEMSEKIKNARKRLGLTQQELAEKIDISVMSLRRYESGVRCPNYKTVEKLSNVFGVSISYLTGLSTPTTDLPEFLPEEFNNFERLIEEEGYRVSIDDDGEWCIVKDDRRVRVGIESIKYIMRMSKSVIVSFLEDAMSNPIE